MTFSVFVLPARSRKVNVRGDDPVTRPRRRPDRRSRAPFPAQICKNAGGPSTFRGGVRRVQPMSERGQSRHVDRSPITSGLARLADILWSFSMSQKCQWPSAFRLVGMKIDRQLLNSCAGTLGPWAV